MAYPSSSTLPPATTLSIIPEGPLRDWAIEGVLLINGSTGVVLPALNVTVPEVWELDVSRFYPPTLFPPDITFGQTKRSIIQPLQTSVEVRDIRQVPAQSAAAAAGGATDADVVMASLRSLDMTRVRTVEFVLRLRRTPESAAYEVRLPKMQLTWREGGNRTGGVAAVADQASEAARANEFTQESAIGAVAASSSEGTSSASATGRFEQASNLYMEWEVAPGSVTLANRVLLITHEQGMQWRFLRAGDKWWLHSLTAIVALHELGARRGGTVHASLTLNAIDGGRVPLATQTARVWSISDNPAMPTTVLRVTNGTWHVVPFSASSEGWSVELSLREEVTDRCHATLPTGTTRCTLRQVDIAASTEFLDIPTKGGIGEVRLSGRCSWVVQRFGDDKFYLLYVLYYSS